MHQQSIYPCNGNLLYASISCSRRVIKYNQQSYSTYQQWEECTLEVGDTHHRIRRHPLDTSYRFWDQSVSFALSCLGQVGCRLTGNGYDLLRDDYRTLGLSCDIWSLLSVGLCIRGISSNMLRSRGWGIGVGIRNNRLTEIREVIT